MQTTSNATTSGWWSAANALIFAILGALLLATGPLLLGMMFLTIAAVTALEAADELVWLGSQRWLQYVRHLLNLVAIIVGGWFLVDLITRWR